MTIKKRIKDKIKADIAALEALMAKKGNDLSWDILLAKAELIKAISAMRLEIESGDKSHQRVLGILELSKNTIERLENEIEKLKE